MISNLPECERGYCPSDEELAADRRRSASSDDVPLPWSYDRRHENNGKPGRQSAGVSRFPAGVQKADSRQDDESGWQFRPMTSEAFDRGDFRRQWLARYALVQGMPAIIGGPSKAMKTSLSVDLAISLGTGTQFLGHFAVPRAVRVAFLSGESGEATLQETARRVCRARGVRLSDADVLWQTDLPSFGYAVEVAELAGGLQQSGVGVVILDPLYLMLLAGAGTNGPRAENVMEIGPLLRRVGSACVNAGVTPILCHHTRKGVGRDPLELPELAYAGVAEYARQWMLINRRERYDGSGIHRLWLTIGGSAGHGGDWGIDIDEGTIDDNFGGRGWDLTITPRSEVRERRETAAANAKEERQMDQFEKDKANLLDAIKKLAGRDGHALRTESRDLARLTQPRFVRALDALISDGFVREVEFEILSGAGRKAKRKGKRLVPVQSVSNVSDSETLFRNTETV